MDLEKKREIFEIEYKKNITLDFGSIFKNDNPVHLEIGSGRGEFILEKSKKNPMLNFIAVDVKEKRVKTILRKMDETVNSNIRVIKMFINEESIRFFPEYSFEKIYLMFPDPWPKRKHNRRRIINREFIKILNELLKKNGILEIVTDHKDYANWIVTHFKETKLFKPKYKDYFSREPEEEHITTYFEEKMRNLGYIPYYFKFIKD